MSGSNDPVAVILDTLHTAKIQSHRVLNKTVDAIKNSDTYEYLEGMVTGTAKSIQTISPPPAPPSFWDRTTLWVQRNKWLVGTLVVGATGGTIFYYFHLQKQNSRPRRRAKKAPNGARKEVVLIVGSPSEGMTRIIADDLNKRGFIVYMTTSSADEESIVLREGSTDIRPLPIKTQEASSIEQTAQHLTAILETPVTVFDGEPAHKLTLAGVLVVPDLYFPTGPMESIRVDTWSDLVYSKLLGPIFLLTNGLLDVVRAQNSRVILLSPNIMSSLNPAFHAAECMTTSALSSLALCLHRELQPQNVPVVHLKLGSFDLHPGRHQSQKRQINNAISADVLGWNDRLRSLYGTTYRAAAHLQTAKHSSGSNLRVLNHAVFDALTVARPKRVYYVGRGSYAYRWLADRVPESLMSWLLQPREARIEEDVDWEAV